MAPPNVKQDENDEGDRGHQHDWCQRCVRMFTDKPTDAITLGCDISGRSRKCVRCKNGHRPVRECIRVCDQLRPEVDDLVNRANEMRLPLTKKHEAELIAKAKKIDSAMRKHAKEEAARQAQLAARAAEAAQLQEAARAEEVAKLQEAMQAATVAEASVTAQNSAVADLNVNIKQVLETLQDGFASIARGNGTQLPTFSNQPVVDSEWIVVPRQVRFTEDGKFVIIDEGQTGHLDQGQADHLDQGLTSVNDTVGACGAAAAAEEAEHIGEDVAGSGHADHEDSDVEMDLSE